MDTVTWDKFAPCEGRIGFGVVLLVWTSFPTLEVWGTWKKAQVDKCGRQ